MTIKPHLESMSEEVAEFIEACPHHLWKLRRALVKLRGELLVAIDVCNEEALVDRLQAMSLGRCE
jgi:hypothetical protein